MTTIIAHVYNEEYLLPFWIHHHVNLFDNGIIIDFQCTDNSIEIVRELAPHWKIINSPMTEFEADKLDRYIESLEKEIFGVRMCLNITEFLLGDPSGVHGQKIVPQVSLINMPFDPPFERHKPFHQQRTFGLLPSVKNINSSSLPILAGPSGRSIHSESINYPLGRHFNLKEPCDMLIYRVSDCFVSQEMYERRLQIQQKIPKSENLLRRGDHHTNFGKGLNRGDLERNEIEARALSTDLSLLLHQAEFLQEFSRKCFTGELIEQFEIQRAWRIAQKNWRVSGLPELNYVSNYAQHELETLSSRFQNSNSWKITSPLRKAGRMLKKIRDFID